MCAAGRDLGKWLKWNRRFGCCLTIVAIGLSAGKATAQIRITEYEYSGNGVAGEFIEFTNVGASAINMTGWTFDDGDQLDGPRTDLSDFGIVAPGQSVILSETDAATFKTKWSLGPSIVVIGSNMNNLGRNDTIHIWDNTNTIVDQLDYGDQTFPGTIRAQNQSGWPCSDVVGSNQIGRWRLAQPGDQQGSSNSTEFNIGSPGAYTSAVCPPDPTGACCAPTCLGGVNNGLLCNSAADCPGGACNGLCTVQTQTECAGYGIYQGDGSACTSCPSPSGANVKITEYEYQGLSGEFIEFHNFGASSVNMTGWSYSDEARIPGQVSLSAFGTIAAGETVVLTEAVAADFRTDWGLSGTVKVIGNKAVHLGSADEINLYDNSGARVDRLTFGHITCEPDTNGKSAWPCAAAVGQNEPLHWRKSVVGDAAGSHTSIVGDIGSPGVYNSITCNPGSCCINNACSVMDQNECLNQIGLYLGDGTNCGSTPCPAADNTPLRITEFMYQGLDGEFFELTNLGASPVNMNGWSFADTCQAPGSFPLAALGTVNPGQSVIVTDQNVTNFRNAWGLSGSVPVMKLPSSELGSNDRIRLHSPAGAIVDEINYGSTPFPGSPDTIGFSAWPGINVVGQDKIYGWKLSDVGDAQASQASTNGDVGNPGRFNQVETPIVPSVSMWGAIAMAQMLLIAGSIVVRRNLN